MTVKDPKRWERQALNLLIEVTGVEPVEEYRFDNRPKDKELGLPRKWRFDFAYVDKKIALEVEGATWVGGRHTHPIGFQKDCEKYNEATKQGWRVYRVTPQLLTLEYIQELILLV